MRVTLLFVAALVLAGCVTVPESSEVGPVVRPDVPVTIQDMPEATQPSELTSRQEAIVAAAMLVVETQSTLVGDTTYNYDCSGTILTIYAHAGIYLVELFSRYPGNGVARLHGIARDYKLLHSRPLPEPGDLIFWDNTYDRNQDGSWNDPLTHAGIVIGVDENGTIEYVHHNYSRGIVTARMTPGDPETHKNGDGEVLNSPMRMASQRAANPDLWLSSHLLREFASMHRIELAAASSSGEAAVASVP